MEYHKRKISIENGRIEFDRGENFDHWANFIFILISIGFIGFGLIMDSTGIKQIITTLIFIVIVGLFLMHKISCTRLRQYQTKLTSSQFQSANLSAARLNEWIVLHNRKDYFEAIKTAGWQWEGFRITSILEKNKILVNSMVSPAINSNPFSFGLNKKNLNELLRQYENSIMDKEV